MIRQVLESVGLFSPPPEGRKVDKGRSPRWPAVRDKFLAMFPACEVCGCKDKRYTTAHHVQPFHLFRGLELDPSNLLTLCESPARNCHLVFGHLYQWTAWNPDVRIDAARWRDKVRARKGV